MKDEVLERLQAATRERHKGRNREFYVMGSSDNFVTVVKPVIKKEPKIKKKKLKVKNVAKVTKKPAIQIQPIIDKSIFTINDLVFYEVPRGKLSKPKRKYNTQRKEQEKAFLEKQKRIKQIAANLNI